MVTLLLDPRVTVGVLPAVIRIEVNEDTANLPVADLKDVAPTTGAPLGHTRAPLPTVVFSVAGAFADDVVAARKYPVEIGIMVSDKILSKTNTISEVLLSV